MKWASPFKLSEKGILGMNARNFSYVLSKNKRELYPLVDDKMETKRIALLEDLSVPDLICCLKYNHQMKELHKILKTQKEFVVKPAKGCAGKGILVIVDRNEKGFVKASGSIVSYIEFDRHVASILTGMYSLGGVPDSAMFEKLVHFTDTFNGYTYQGVPDIRVIIYRGYPVMAMTRLSTKVSDGKANLHQGAVGVGLDIVTGKAIQAVQFNKLVTKHPDTGQSFEGLAIPDWDTVLKLSAKSFDITELGYLGADIVLDRDRGPLILELNARPGLSIQIANGHGLGRRLRYIDSVNKKRRNIDEKLALVKEKFANFK